MKPFCSSPMTIISSPLLSVVTGVPDSAGEE
jgi:hypothetical protein